MRIALGVEYDGSAFSGWQRQNGARTVQGCVEAALSKVADHPVQVMCAGRTDAGVHARGQVIHFETGAVRTARSWIFGANANLPKDVTMLWAQPVSDDFHARFSARRRRYRYVILSRPVRPTFLAGRVSWDYRAFDETRMAMAASCLVGEHDFTSYRALACQAKTPIRTLYHLDVTRQDDLIFIDLAANGFLHHMVRNIAGVLMAIGAGEREPAWARQILGMRDRTVGGVTASPCGLYLMEVNYPEDFAIPPLGQSAMVW
jgi:tRNA pseudouridine38-40 synthase